MASRRFGLRAARALGLAGVLGVLLGLTACGGGGDGSTRVASPQAWWARAISPPAPRQRVCRPA